ncbi:MAG: response regulator [Magnetococcales bacterium]|nr:response regulator [Magnetococcales bacterium]
MPVLQHLSLAYRIAAGFAILLILLILQYLFFDYHNQQLGTIHNRLVQHPFTVTSAVLKLEREVQEIRFLSALIHTGKNHEEIRSMEQRMQNSWEDLQVQLEIIQSRFLGDKARVRETRSLLETWWHVLVHREITALFENQTAESLAMHTSPEYRQRLQVIENNINYITAFAQEKAFSLSSEFDRSGAEGKRIVFLFFVGMILLGLLVALLALRAITHPLNQLNQAVTDLAAKRFTIQVPGTTRQDEFGTLARSIEVLQGMARMTDEEVWIKSQVSSLSVELQQFQELEPFSQGVLNHVTPLVNGVHGACYLLDEAREVLELKAGHGLHGASLARQTIPVGENLVGMCARQKQMMELAELPKGYIRITSALGESQPGMLLLAPLLFQDRVLGVVEIAALQTLTDSQRALLQVMLPVIAIHLESLKRQLRTRELLRESQNQAQLLQRSETELLAQSEELRVINEALRSKSATLEQQTMELSRSEEELKNQGEELLVTNEELRQKNSALEQNAHQLRQARQLAERTAGELELASRYKSEFLANMSHELRTPLNSLLILARSLAINTEGNLTADQQESAQIIHDSGRDLLLLINDILDLSKVESGKMETTCEPVLLDDLFANLRRRFTPLAMDKGLSLAIGGAPELPPALLTDPHKLERVLINLLANGIKFTETGKVALVVDRVSATTPGENREFLTFAVHDTGIGIPPGNEERIFQAFQQLDGTTSRRHGGTGLGLSIARQLTGLLGGKLEMVSAPGAGSTFTITLPLHEPAPETLPSALASLPGPPEPVTLLPAPAPPRRTVLIIEDDPVFARILGDLARARGFVPLMSTTGQPAMTLARENTPEGVILDLTLPDVDGWSVLKQLKSDPDTREIPVHIISARDESAASREQGAEDYWVKPVSREQIETVLQRIARKQGGLEPRHVLVVEDDPNTRKAITTLLSSAQVKTTCVATAEEAFSRLTRRRSVA